MSQRPSPARLAEIAAALASLPNAPKTEIEVALVDLFSEIEALTLERDKLINYSLRPDFGARGMSEEELIQMGKDISEGKIHAPSYPLVVSRRKGA